MTEEFTGSLDAMAKDRIRLAIEGVEKIKKMTPKGFKKITQKELGSAVGMKQSAVSQAKKGHVKRWSKKLKKLVLYAEAKIKENAEAMLQEEIAQYLAVGGRENVLGGILALLMEEQKHRRASAVRVMSTERAKSPQT